jgi:hypothetical protein
MRDFIEKTFEFYTNPRFLLWMIVATLILLNLVVYLK